MFWQKRRILAKQDSLKDKKYGSSVQKNSKLVTKSVIANKRTIIIIVTNISIRKSFITNVMLITVVIIIMIVIVIIMRIRDLVRCSSGIIIKVK